MDENVKVLTELYGYYEEAAASVAAGQKVMREYKKQMMEIIQNSGVEYYIIAGSDVDALKLSVETVEREVLNKKSIADQLGLKVKDLTKIEEWVRLTNEGKLTPEMIESAKTPEQREQFTVEVYDENPKTE